MKLLAALTSGALAQNFANFGLNFDELVGAGAPSIGAPSGNTFDIPTDVSFDAAFGGSAPSGLGGNAINFDTLVAPGAAPAAPAAAPAAPAAAPAAPAAPAFDLGPALEASFDSFDSLGEGDDERYGIFSTTPPTPTTTDNFDLGFDCWKCDRMTFEDCAIHGSFNNCPSGDYDVCFIEVRETRNNLQQICTGCKDEQACANLKFENFRGATSTVMDQCRSDSTAQLARTRWGGARQSVCRQCFNTCDSDSTVDQDPKNWCPTYQMASSAVHLMNSATTPDQSSFRIPKWDLSAHWSLGTAAGHGDHKEDDTFWRVDLVAEQMTNLNVLIASGAVLKNDFDGDVDYNADGSINMNNSG